MTALPMREKCWGVTQRNEAIVYISPTSCGEITPKCQRKRIFEVRELFTIRSTLSRIVAEGRRPTSVPMGIPRGDIAKCGFSV